MNKFAPTIYEHAASLINKTPSETAYNEDLLVEGHLKAFQLYKHALITAGIDIYNVEAEALGLGVTRYSDNSLPSVEGRLDDVSSLKVPDLDQGRLRLHLNAGNRLLKETGALVNGALVGPYTLAAILEGFENFTIKLLTEPEAAQNLMEFTLKVCIFYAREFLTRGMGITVNESWIAPPLLSPEIYREHISPLHKRIFYELKEFDLSHSCLICGGNTTPIVQYLAATGTSLVMADANCDVEHFKNICRKNDIMLRASINPALLLEGSEEDIKKSVSYIIDKCFDYEKSILGCGIVPFETPFENVLLFKEIFTQLMP